MTVHILEWLKSHNLLSSWAWAPPHSQSGTEGLEGSRRDSGLSHGEVEKLLLITVEDSRNSDPTGQVHSGPTR